jgi:hypothetical protein
MLPPRDRDPYIAWRPPFPEPVLTRDKTALLVIDMQYRSAHPDFGMCVKLREAGFARALYSAAKNAAGMTRAAPTARVTLYSLPGALSSSMTATPTRTWRVLRNDSFWKKKIYLHCTFKGLERNNSVYCIDRERWVSPNFCQLCFTTFRERKP